MGVFGDLPLNNMMSIFRVFLIWLIFSRMASKLNAAMDKIRNTSDSVAGFSQEVREISNRIDISAGQGSRMAHEASSAASEISNCITGIASAAEEVSSQITDVNRNSDTVTAEIKYKKFGQPEPAGIYSVFKSDVLVIHFKDGSKKNYIATSENNQMRTDRQFMSMRFNFGFGLNYYDRSANDNLLEFWRYYNQNDNLSITNKKYCYSYMVNMTSTIGVSKRNMLSSCFELYMFPKGFVNASNSFYGDNEINLTGWGMLVSLTLGHSINYKKNLSLA